MTGLSEKRAALIIYLTSLKDAELNVCRSKALAEKFDVYWMVASRQIDLETERRRAAK